MFVFLDDRAQVSFGIFMESDGAVSVRMQDESGTNTTILAKKTFANNDNKMLAVVLTKGSLLSKGMNQLVCCCLFV